MADCVCCSPDSLFSPCSDINSVTILGTDMSLHTVGELTVAFPPADYIFRFAITRDAVNLRTRLWFSHFNDSGTALWVELCNGGINLIYDLQDLLLFNGAMQDTILNGGKVESVILKEVSVDPGAQATIYGAAFNPGVDLRIVLTLCHEDVGQVLDLDMDVTVLNPGDNVNTKASIATMNETPTTPAVAYESFAVVYTIPHTNLDQDFYTILRLTRDNGGADTGDLHLLSVGVYQ